MSGHSKWASIKHKKAAVDAKRGKIFTKIIREITVAAKTGGGDPDTNPRLRLAISNAKSSNMPADNIDRAVKKGTGTLDGFTYEEVVYEGYGAAGVAIYVQCLTDNKNRTVSEIRNIFSKKNGNLAGAGSVAWIFEMKGLITVDANAATEDKLMEIVLNAGAEDFSREGDNFEIVTQPHDFEAVKKAIEDAKIPVGTAALTRIPKNLTPVDAANARSVLDLIEALEDHDDVQNVYANCDIPDEVMKEVG
ncbi:MAG: transcriptional regulator [Omnitrophica bacterium RIFCSPLOWO2_12_FULL_44_17]|uniref:Probable transcriptional regulatory protein A3G33_00025 n=1 Tax=Candidatus Danuiimicrobium aquiferis TaxID=1801832 RepID=A0A1G1KST4_9BACT|nr:MAG: transcriptional regulator [Omnitrophica bacterium RIFCSPHIGHO2_02_FULL_45_28]OGW88272.1 MAG: transcriptional regulator [Omnitrophica bacterium RIFCSPHIGHO2_12_FULL_44_12]OGW95967.1 MAG: transcriptional regulator [Omnitrophica bacterium RIFCSPLOWO2_12_FULL_44_17]OGX01961.1 MAG: transcriptional regulator [Omnitrophica bacterium RIFCSPLOWO2_02_FULL_44_11]